MFCSNRYVAMLTADHGFMPAPEFSQAQGQSAGRLSSSQLLAKVNAELETRFGAPKLAPFISASTAVVLDRKLIAQRGLDFDRVAEAARAMLLAEPAVAAAYTRRELESGSKAGALFFEAMRKSWHKDISGDIQFALKPYWMTTSSSGYIATHGSPHGYDTQVPLLLYGPAWLKPGRIDERVEIVDLAPTVARLLGIAAPSSSEGKPLPLAAP
jgi:arylsulfatase A-like enzyme